MFLHKQIQFDHVDTITKKLLSIAQRFNPDAFYSRSFDYGLVRTEIPELHEQFVNKNMLVEIFREFVSPPFNGLPPHVDGSAEHPRTLALNWPIENCAGTKMLWWEFDGDPLIERIGHDVAFTSSPLTLYSKKNGTVMGECELTVPTLVNVKQYHSIDNGPLTRRMISFRFRPEPYHLIDTLV